MAAILMTLMIRRKAIGTPTHQALLQMGIGAINTQDLPAHCDTPLGLEAPWSASG